MRIRVLCAGDSYTVGEGVAAPQSWPYLLADGLTAAGVACSLQVVGAPGMTAADLGAEIRRASPQPPFHLVTAQAGVNDQYRGNALERFGDDVGSLLDTLQPLTGADPGRILFVSIPDWSVTPHAAGRRRSAIAAEIDRFNEVARVRVGASGAGWVDVTAASREAADRPGMLAADGLHPAAGQYRTWMETIGPAAAGVLRGVVLIPPHPH